MKKPNLDTIRKITKGVIIQGLHAGGLHFVNDQWINATTQAVLDHIKTLTYAEFTALKQSLKSNKKKNETTSGN